MSRRALFLDVGWTLIYPEQSMWELLADLASTAGGTMSAAACEAAIHPLWQASQDHTAAEFRSHSEYEDSDEAFIIVFRRLAELGLSLAGVTSPPDALLDQFVRAMGDWDRWRVYPDVEEHLRLLRNEGVVLVAVSNAATDMPQFLEHLGVGQHLDCVIASAAEGRRKPDRLMFERALAYADVAPHEAIHVGDMGLEDVLGARNVGVASALIHRGAQSLFPSFPPKLPAGAEGTPIVADLADVRALLASG
jgi:putative hydrolase of the HAD superfamily